MDGLLVATFPDEAAACEGVTARRELNAWGAIRLDRLAMITRQPDDALTLEHDENDCSPPSRTLAGIAAGALTGLLAGVPGFVVGAGVGGLIGRRPAHTLRKNEFLSDVAKTLAPGACAIVVEANEVIVSPVDDRMHVLGGVISRAPHQSR